MVLPFSPVVGHCRLFSHSNGKDISFGHPGSDKCGGYVASAVLHYCCLAGVLRYVVHGIYIGVYMSEVYNRPYGLKVLNQHQGISQSSWTSLLC